MSILATEDIERPFKCEQCEKAFKTAAELNRHKTIHSSEQCIPFFTIATNFARTKRSQNIYWMTTKISIERALLTKMNFSRRSREKGIFLQNVRKSIHSVGISIQTWEYSFELVNFLMAFFKMSSNWILINLK